MKQAIITQCASGNFSASRSAACGGNGSAPFSPLSALPSGRSSLAFSISLGVGLRDLVDREFHNRPGFWEISVLPGNLPQQEADDQIPAEAIRVDGDFDADRTARLRGQLIQRYRQSHAAKPPAMLTDETVAQIAALPEVMEVLTARFGQGWAYWGKSSAFVSVVSGRSDQPLLAERLVAGRMPEKDAAECVASEMLLFDLGIRSESAMQAALGTKLEIEVRRAAGLAPCPRAQQGR